MKAFAFCYFPTSLLFIRHEIVTKKFAKSKNFVFIILEFVRVYEETVYIMVFVLKLSKIKMSINDTIFIWTGETLKIAVMLSVFVDMPF